ncbi:MAG: glycosyltransferase [Cyanobacteriota bacterium]|nr:glycosyltransferase [Cyanobacteriota bacterium]
MTRAVETPITILLPVHGRAELLGPALDSVLAQTSSAWRLRIADDGSDARTRQWLATWMERHALAHDVRWLRRPRNLGLFANLNATIETEAADWWLLLCSDDMLLPTAVETLTVTRRRWPEARLILSTFDSIGPKGEARPADSAAHHDRLSPATALIPAARFVPALLELGSLNGNLTGMAFQSALWHDAGPFRADWRHAADWEWLIRAAERGPVLLNRTPIALVRTHPAQLSNVNRRSGHDTREVAEVVGQLHRHPLLRTEPRRHQWAAHVMQFHLWNLLKQLRHGPTRELGSNVRAIQHAAGLMQTVGALVAWLPERWRKHRDGTSR